MAKHLTPVNLSLAFLCLALAVRAADNPGALWLMALSWAGGLVSGMLIGCGAITRAD